MGARPLFGLIIVGFPERRLSLDILVRILDGAREKADEAGISIIGGHTIEDSEPKYGLAVTGIADPAKILRNSTARPGDILVLTKPIGTGVIATAMKRGAAPPDVSGEAISLMSRLNRLASESLDGLDPGACTDITGFGLIGHLMEMTVGSGVDAEIWKDEVGVIGGTRELISEGFVPGGTRNNLEFTSGNVDWDRSITEGEKLLLCDAQTSGGLLVTLREKEAGLYVEKLLKDGEEARIIGKITGKGGGRIMVVPGRKA